MLSIPVVPVDGISEFLVVQALWDSFTVKTQMLSIVTGLLPKVQEAGGGRCAC